MKSFVAAALFFATSVFAQETTTVAAIQTPKAQPTFTDLFPNKKPIIAVINVQGLPGQKNFVSMEKSIKDALDQLKILEEEGVDGALFENVDGDFSSTPEMTAAMAVIVHEAVKHAKKVVIGIEILWHDPVASLAIAKASGAKFIRTDFWIDKMKAGKRIVDEKPKKILEYAKKIGADDVLIFTDIQVKYAEMLDKKKSITTSAKQALASGSAGAIVSGPKSGMAPDLEKLKKAKLDGFPLILGSGTSTQNIRELLGVADAAIVGTSVSTKTGGVLVKEKVREYMALVKEIRAQQAN